MRRLRLSKSFFILVVHALLLISTIFLLFFKKKKLETFINPFKEFEKSLTGQLYHFKCPNCEGFFAIKKSKSNNKKTIKLTCPDCGIIGVIPPDPFLIEEEIPKKKSIKVNFICNICGEGITIWAEGTEMINNTQVFSCPFCGRLNTMNKS